MRRINPTINGKRYEQVSKPTARKLFKQGRTIYLSEARQPIAIQAEINPERIDSFDKMLEIFERGRRANYFICIEPPTIQEAAAQLLQAWNDKAERNRLKKKFNSMFDPSEFSKEFKSIQANV